MNTNKINVFIILVIFFSISLSPLGAVAKGNLTLGVHPFLSDEVLKNKFTPLANYLSHQTGLNVVVRVGSNYDEHILFSGLDKLDIAYMGPASYIKMVNDYGRKPILAKLEVNGVSYFQGNIIARKESKIKILADLAGKRIAFGDSNSTMSYIVPHYVMHQAGVFVNQFEKHQFLYSHNNVALAVLSGDYDAGAVKPAVFRQFEEKGLRIVAKTPKISEHLFITRSDLPNEQVIALRKAMLNIKKSKMGMAALRNIKKSIINLVEAANDDYDNLRKIIFESKNLH